MYDILWIGIAVIPTDSVILYVLYRAKLANTVLSHIVHFLLYRWGVYSTKWKKKSNFAGNKGFQLLFEIETRENEFRSCLYEFISTYRIDILCLQLFARLVFISSALQMDTIIYTWYPKHKQGIYPNIVSWIRYNRSNLSNKETNLLLIPSIAQYDKSTECKKEYSTYFSCSVL